MGVCHLLNVFNTLLTLSVCIGGQPGFPYGCIAFGCLQVAGNDYSRRSRNTSPPPPAPNSNPWILSRAEDGALGCPSFPLNALGQLCDSCTCSDAPVKVKLDVSWSRSNDVQVMVDEWISRCLARKLLSQVHISSQTTRQCWHFY